MVEGRPSILVVDDDPGHRAMLRTVLKGWGYATGEAGDGAAGVEAVRNHSFDLVLMDVRMAVMDGIAALKAIKAYNPAVPVVVMTAFSAVDSAVEALKSGAYDYLTKPLDFDVLRLTLDNAIDHAGLKAENRELRERIDALGDPAGPGGVPIIGRSEPMRRLLEMVAMVGPSEATVLIAGESGTGKELVARAVHAASPRRNGPLVAVNCGALAETVLESELFGHERGAFTGAERRRDGRFMQADGGTIFLDEVGEVSPAMQVRLLRVIQEREIQRVGSDRPEKVDVRIVAATNRDLAAEVTAGRFREDLYYRLNVVALAVPPLRERTDDIPLIATHFLTRFAERNRKRVKGFAPRAMDMLAAYSWPGNVRELENSVERAVVLLTGEYVTERELPLTVVQAWERREGAAGVAGASAAGEPGMLMGGAADGRPGETPAPAAWSGLSSRLSPTLPLDEIEKQAVLAALHAAGGNKSETARRLGITRKTLHAKLAKYGAE